MRRPSCGQNSMPKFGYETQDVLTWLERRARPGRRLITMPAALPATPQAVRDGKVIVHFRHTGSAPILKNQKFKVPADARFSTVTTLLRSHLRLSNDDPLVRPHCCSARHALSDGCVCARA